MVTETNTAISQKSQSLRKKLLFRLDTSNRIFLITEKQKEESHGDDNFNVTTGQTIDKENDIKPKSQKESFKKSCRNALDGWKRKITKIRRVLLFCHKTSSEITSNEIQTPTSSHPLISDLSPSIISNDATSNQLLTTNKNNNITESSESEDALVKLIDEIIDHNEATLNDLLAGADKLQKAPLSRTSIHRRRKRFIIACNIVLIALTIIITIIIFVVFMTLRYKAHKNRISKTSYIYYV